MRAGYYRYNSVAMKQRLNQKRNMKTRNMFLTVGAVILAVTSLNTFAASPLLTPRAAGNQVKHVTMTDAPTVTITYVDAPTALLTPRAASNQTKTVKGVDNSVNPSLRCSRDMMGSPKAIAECASHPGAPMPCCNPAVK